MYAFISGFACGFGMLAFLGELARNGLSTWSIYFATVTLANAGVAFLNRNN